MSQPFISICIPTYKRTALLRQLLDSIGMQTFKDLEILINDNSPDDSVKTLVNSYSSRLPIQYEKNEPAVPAVENGIKVMRRAKGEWIKIMHDDDWFADAASLQQFADKAKNCNASFIFSAYHVVELETGNKESKYLSPENKKALERSPFSQFFLNTIGHPSVVMHRRDTQIEYDSNYHWVLDIDFYMRYMSAHPGFCYIDQLLVNIGKSAGQESSRYYKNGKVEIPEYFSMLAKYEPELMIKQEEVFHMVWNMVKRYKITAQSQLKDFGYDGPAPLYLQQIIDAQRCIPDVVLKQPSWSKVFMQRCYRKLHQGLNK